MQAWDEEKRSTRPITYDTVLKLAKTYKSLSGKWLFFLSTGKDIDKAWASIARAVVAGECGTTAKVSTCEGNGKNHVICVYNSDFTDHQSILDLESQIRRAGIVCRMTYKPDAFTHLGIYERNEWRLRPVIYVSEYDMSQETFKVKSMLKRVTTLEDLWYGKKAKKETQS